MFSTYDGDMNFRFFNNVCEIGEISENELLPIFKTFIHSPAAFQEGERLNSKWRYSTAIPIDIDNGVKMKKVIQFFKKVGINFILYPSKSHNKEKNGIVAERFHIFLLPPEIIETEKRYLRYVTFFINKLKGDMACKDRARFFFPNPNLKKGDIVISLDGNFDWHRIPKIKKDQLTNEDVSKSDDKNWVAFSPDGGTSAASFFNDLIGNFHAPLKLSHFNFSNRSISYWRDNKDKNPGLFQLWDKRIIIDKTHDRIYNAVYSPEDFITCKEPDRNELRTKLQENVIQTLSTDEVTPSMTFVLTNEGAGKSTAFLNSIKPGHLIVTKDKKRMNEILDQYENTVKKENPEALPMLRIFSNSDIIYTNVYQQRLPVDGHDSAKEMAMMFVNAYNKYIKEMQGIKERRNIQQLLAQKRNNNYDKDQDSELISLKAFLGTLGSSIDEEEVDMILRFYLEQMYSWGDSRNKYVFITTAHKLLVGTKHMPALFSNIVVHMDEYLSDIFSPGKVFDKDSIHFKDLYPFAKTEFRHPKTKKAYFLCSIYGEMNEYIVEYDPHVALDIKGNNIHLIIYTTEELPLGLHLNEDYEVIDYRHNILEEKLNVIALKNLNGRSVNYHGQPLHLGGRERTQYVVDMVERDFGVDKDMIIVDGIQHSENMANVQGRNRYLNRVIEAKDEISFAIILKHLHPNQIAKYLPFLVPEYRLFKKEFNVSNFKEYLDHEDSIRVIKNRIISDLANQSIGRVGGYRRHENLGKIYLVLNMNLLDELELNYVTRNVFKYSSMKRNGNTDNKIWEFLDEVTFNLKVTQTEFVQIKRHNRDIRKKKKKGKQIIENIITSKLMSGRSWAYNQKKITKSIVTTNRSKATIQLLSQSVKQYTPRVDQIPILKKYYRRVFFEINKIIRKKFLIKQIPLTAYEEFDRRYFRFLNFNKFFKSMCEKLCFKGECFG